MINIKAINIELSNSINKYINKRINIIIEKFASRVPVSCFVEVERTTNHHKQGDVYKAEIKMNINGVNFITASEREDLYKAIDDAKEQLVRKITQRKGRNKTLFKRGATSIKKMLKGISKRNPFTSKY